MVVHCRGTLVFIWFGQGEGALSELFERAGAGFRVYKNTLFLIAMDDAQHVQLSKALRRSLAISDIQKDESLTETFTKESRDELRKKAREAERDNPFRVLSAYRYLAILEKSGIEWKDLGIPTVGTNETLTGRVRQYLRDQEKLLTAVTPKYILDKAFAKEEKEKSLREIYELSLKAPGISIPETEKVLLDAIENGVRTGILGIREGSEVYHKEKISPIIDSIVLRGEYARTLTKEEEPKIEEEKTPERVEERKKEGLVGKLLLRATLSWDKLSDVIKGVIGPLKDKGSAPRITTEIEASSEEGFDRTTLDSKVKETLQQIGATIEEWKEE